MLRRRRTKDGASSRREAGPAAAASPIANGKWLSVLGARHNNLKGIDVHFPLGRFIAVTGVSGSGKSSLVNDILREALARDLNGAATQPGPHEGIVGTEALDKILDIDQTPIGRTPRSNPATYIKVFDRIRDLYTRLPEAKRRGYKPGRFSFNVSGGRCEACEGNGSNRLEMDFLADVWVTCPVCEGRRFNRETLQVRFKDKSIHDVLEMDVQEALGHFENIPDVQRMLKTLHDVGLDYLKLGQPSPTLSGGEAQRIKLARELCRKSTGRTLYVLDEPTTGLHFADIRRLLLVLHGFVDAGNTVVVIEHNLDVIKTADWVIDLGPEGGEAGGRVVAAGTPEQVAATKASHTGKALAAILSPRKFKPSAGAPATIEPARPMEAIEIDGAAQHNLKHLSTRIPLKKTTVFSGPSGSGKSSLAIDTLYAEGQRRYVESLSAYARQFLGQMQKPVVERVNGLSPAICIEQKAPSKSPRSTVGTVTEVYDYFRILFARLGQPHCPDCNLPIGTQTSDEIIDRLLVLPEGSKVYLMAPVSAAHHEDFESLFRDLVRSGFQRIRVDGRTHEVERPPSIDRRRKHQIEVIVDRAVIRHNQRSRVADSVEAALDLGKGVLHVAHVDERVDERKWKVDRYSQHFSCDRCGRGFAELTPNMFSFNASSGWCPACEGLGVQAGGGAADIEARGSLSIRQGAIPGWPTLFDPDSDFTRAIAAVARHAGFSLDEPFEDLRPEDRRTLYYGTGEEWLELGDGKGTLFQYKGIFPAVSEAARVSWVYRNRLSDLVGEVACPTCKGSRLADYPAATLWCDRTIGEWSALPLGECLEEIRRARLKPIEKKIAGELLREIKHRLEFLVDVGLEYLTLGRSTPTLSGGEAQRIRLASQLGSGLTGVLYILDEPTIGLHPRDNGRLLSALGKLRDLGNTVVMVEHDREVIRAADHLIDFGPGAGRFGGQIVAEGPPAKVAKAKDSLTGQYLRGAKAIPVPAQRRPTDGPALEVKGAAHHNLQRLDARIPLGCFVAVAGVSGSGKSSLVVDVVWAALARRLHRAQVSPGLHEEIVGIELIDKVINVDQQPIGMTPTSNPATYTGVFDVVRELFAQMPEAKVRGYSAGRFSFNKPGGRCEACEGSGQKKIEMHFLPDVWITCDVCKGKRYTPETLAVQYKGKSIADVLEMSAGEARELFANVPRLARLLSTLCDVGLDYMPLGQSAATLSGGESQRVKLAAELARPNTGRTLYVLDEPTTGLHFEDVRRLLDVLHRLVDLGNTVLVIEHNLDLMKTADWVLEMGPEAGEAGGRLVFSGTPEQLAQAGEQGASHTGKALAPVLAAGPVEERLRFDPLAQAAAQTALDDAPLELGADVPMPWEVDGRRWHTVDRVSRSGKPVKWDGEALAHVVDLVQELGVFGPTNWNDRTVVEIAAARRSDGWFLHALTGEEWLLRLKFRPGRGAFKRELLARQLGLKPLDELKDVPLYGAEPRVKVRMLRSLFQEVELTVHKAEEIQTTAFREFLEKAVGSFSKTIDKTWFDPAGAQPWTANGRAWHFARTGFKPGRKIRWEESVLPLVVRTIELASPAATWDWSSRDSAKRRFPGVGITWARLMTKQNRALELHLAGPKGLFNLAAIDRFGIDQKIRTTPARVDVIVLYFLREDELSADAFLEFLFEHASAFAAEFKP